MMENPTPNPARIRRSQIRRPVNGPTDPRASKIQAKVRVREESPQQALENELVLRAVAIPASAAGIWPRPRRRKRYRAEKPAINSDNGTKNLARYTGPRSQKSPNVTSGGMVPPLAPNQ